MSERFSHGKSFHPAWRLVAIVVFAGLFILGISMVFHPGGRDLPDTDRVSPSPEARQGDEIDQAESVEQGLTFSEEEQKIVDTVKDRTRQKDEPPLYLFLRRTASLPEITDAEMSALGAPSYADLLEYPSRHRARPVRLRIVPWSVRRLAPGRGLSRSPRWPGDRPVWEIHGLNARPDAHPNDDEPVIVFSVVDPTPMLGEPEEIDDQGRAVYYDQPAIEVAGVFYKILTAVSREGEELDYPVITGWQLRRARAEAAPGADMLQALILMVVVALLLILFFYMRRRSQGRGASYPTYHPRRPTDEPEQPEDDEQVDPELREVVEEIKTHGKDDDADGERSSG